MKYLFTILLSVFFFFTSRAADVHPYHVGSVEFSYNSKTKTFEISGKFFLDDLENGINKKYNTNLHFQDEKFKEKMNEAIKIYFIDYVKLKVNNKLLKVNYIGYEEDSEAVNIYLEIDGMFDRTHEHETEGFCWQNLMEMSEDKKQILAEKIFLLYSILCRAAEQQRISQGR